MNRSQHGGALHVVLGIVAVFAVLLGVAMFIGWRVHRAETNRSHTRNVVVPGATWGLSDVHYGWTFAPGADANSCRVALTLTAVPAQTELPGHKIPDDVTSRAPIFGQTVTVKFNESIPPDPTTFTDGTREKSLVTDAQGAAIVEVAAPVNGFFILSAAAKFPGQEGRVVAGAETIVHQAYATK